MVVFHILYKSLPDKRRRSNESTSALYLSHCRSNCLVGILIFRHCRLHTTQNMKRRIQHIHSWPRLCEVQRSHFASERQYLPNQSNWLSWVQRNEEKGLFCSQPTTTFILLFEDTKDCWVLSGHKKDQRMITLSFLCFSI